MSEQTPDSFFITAAVIESADVPAYRTDFDETILSWNSAAEEIYGYSAREIVGEKSSVLFPPAYRKKEAQIFESARQGRQIMNRESVRLKKDGSRLTVSVSAVPVIDRQGEIVAVSKIERVITETPSVSKQLSQAAELQNNQLSEIEAFYQTVPIGLGYIDHNLRYVRVNRQLAEMNGVSAEDHIGHTVREILPSRLAVQVEALVRKILVTGKPALNIETTGETSADPGVTRTWLVNYYPVINPAGNTLGVNVIVQEITEKKQSEEKIRLSREQLQNLIDSFFSFVGILDVDGTLIDIKGPLLLTNPKIKESVGTDFAGIYWWNWSPDVLEKLRVSIDRCAQGEIIHYDAVAKVEENQFLIFDFQLTPVIGEKGKITQLIASGINISERFEFGSKAVHHQQMSFANEIAAGLAHEIKNPLAGIQGAIDILMERQTPDDFEYPVLETIREELIDIDEVLQVFLKRVRPRLMCFVEASLAEIIRKTVQLTDHLLAARGLKEKIKIELDLPSDPYVMMFDIGHIKDALLNLLINAVDAIGEKKGIIRISLSKEGAADFSEAVISIFNSGPYIKKEDLPKLFIPFYTTKKNGNGLGLYAVKRIATAHGGYCSVKSVHNKGTTFTLSLPMDSKV